MPFRNADLGTQMGARSAAQQGALGCLLLGGLTIAAAFLSSSVLDPATLQGKIGLGLVAIQATVCFVAGYRLWNGKGAYWAMAVALLQVIEIATKLITMTALPGLIISAVLLLVVIQGIRGALALRRLKAETATPSS
ncbi:MAG: hypothetical protein ACK4GD_05320 [Sphingomonadaceae bacterium]